MLRGLGLQLARRSYEGDERQVREDDIFSAEFEAHLPNCFHEWQRFDVTNRAADFDDDDIHSVRYFAEGSFDRVGDVRNNLHGLAQIIAAALLGDDGFVDAARGPVMVLGQVSRCEPLVMAKVEIGFRAIVRDKHFAVLIGRHCPRINVQVGIALLEGNAKAAAFKQAAHRSRCHAFSEGRNHAARYEDVFRPGGQGARIPPMESAYDILWRESAQLSI